jgi:transcriptional regulator with XRE-family HTH domain
MNDLFQDLKSEFQNEEYRYAYAQSFLNTKLATQIKTLREQREMTQAKAAHELGIKQPGYRRFEDVNHEVWKTDSLWNIARVYGVSLDINFTTFGTLPEQKKRFSKESLRLPKFEDDPAFKEAEEKPELQPEEVLALISPSDFLTGVEVYTQAANEFIPGLITFESISPHALGDPYRSWIEALTDYRAEPKLLKISFMEQPKAGVQDTENSSASGAITQPYKGSRIVSIDRNKKTAFSRGRSSHKRRAG